MDEENHYFYKAKITLPEMSISDWEKLDLDKYDFEHEQEKKPTLAELHQNFMSSVNEYIRNQIIPD